MTASELRVASALAQHIDRFGEVRILQKQLMDEAKVSQATLTRSLRKLETAGFMTTTRSRKRHNHFDKNVYLVAEEYVLSTGVPDSQPITTGWGALPIAQSENEEICQPTVNESSIVLTIKDEQSTASPGSSNDSKESLNSVIYVPTKTYLKKKDYSIETEENSGTLSNGLSLSHRDKVDQPTLSESRAFAVGPVTAGWEGGKKKSEVLLDIRDWKTRHYRPKSTWTAYDISAEFQALLNEESGRSVGKVDGNRIRGIVCKLRKEVDSFAELEVHVARSIARNPVALKTIIEDVDKAPGVFYNVLTDYIVLWSMAEDPDLWKLEFIATQQRWDIYWAQRDPNPVACDSKYDALLMDPDLPERVPVIRQSSRYKREDVFI